MNYDYEILEALRAVHAELKYANQAGRAAEEAAARGPSPDDIREGVRRGGLAWYREHAGKMGQEQA